MKTTIELPASLYTAAKKAALERSTTLKALIESGLRRELALDAGAVQDPLELLRQLDSEIWNETDADAYVAEQRAKWG